MMNKYLLLLLFLLINSSLYSQLTIDDRIYTDFNNNGLERTETYEILEVVITSFATVQEHISEIASKSIPWNERKKLKSRTLKYFETPNSIIEVTSLITNSKNRRPVSTYLDRLMGLNYYVVTLYWDDTFTVSKLFNNGNGEYEIGLGCWQYFVARNQEGIIVYKDKTYKKSFFTINKDSYGNWIVKINEIKAEETKSYNIKTDY